MSAIKITIDGQEIEVQPGQSVLDGARALGMSGQIGELDEGGFADLVALPFAGKVADIYAAVLHHAGDVAASMIDGQWAIAPT